MNVIVHVLHHGSPLCGFMSGSVPAQWPEHHKWVGTDSLPAFAPSNATACCGCERIVRIERGCPVLLDDPDDQRVLDPAVRR